MGFWDFLRRPQASSMSVFTPEETWIGGTPEEMASALLVQVGGMTPTEMWERQPHLRTVVSFRARNVAHLGLHVFARNGEEDRQRDRTSPMAQLIRRPNPDQTFYELMYGLVADLDLYDRAYWLLGDEDGRPTARRLPPSWVRPVQRDAWGAKSYDVTGANGSSVPVPSDNVLAFTGYHPTNPRTGSPAIEALKETLKEQIEAARFRNQVWKRGGRVSAVLERPKDAPQWTDEQAERFRTDWHAKYTGSGSGAGGTPILEDGMQLKRIDFSAREQEYVEAAKLAFSTVAAVYHVNPTMVGILDNANYSNVREFRRSLYGDSLGPTLAQIEDRINAFLIPRLGMDEVTSYAEFNIGEKLQGSFEEQAAVMQTMVGAPLMTRNEGRAKFNMSAVDGGDELVTPLNVLVGGQASATDSGSQNRAPKARAIKAGAALTKGATDSQVEKVADVLAAFFKRQGKAVLSRIGSGGDWWDGERWDRELADDLLKVSHTLASLIGEAEAERLGYTGGYDADRTVEFLRAVAERRASQVNETTKGQLDEAVASEDGDPGHVFEVAADARAKGVGAAVATFAAGFAAVEAARHIAGDQGVEPVKTWVTGSNPRSAHADMDGETVPIDEPFSNGQDWPGSGGDVDDVAGCNCSVTVSIPD